MNPILQATLEHLDEGKHISRITVDKRKDPTYVIFEFVNDPPAELPIECDHSTFMEWWKRTGTYIRLMGLIKPMDDLK